MRQVFPGMPPFLRCGAALAVGLAGFLAGCASPPLRTARANFYAGRFEQANSNLAAIPKGNKDEILFLMERGMIRQNLGQYENSAQDWRRAGDLDAKLDTYSLSQGASSLIVNDRMLSFRGMPFERTLMYAFLAKNYLADSNWDYAAICARNIIKKLENLDGFPDIAYGRYMAGFCLELIADEGNAAIQYRAAARLLSSDVLIDPLSGDILPPTNVVDALAPISKAALRTEPAELVCFIAMGRMPTGEIHGDFYSRFPPYAEIYHNDEYLGRSYPFANTAALMDESQRRLAAIQLAKDATRIATKVAIAETMKQQNDALGALIFLALFAMEAPDTRCWETLPLWLEVARVPCPADLKSFTVVFKSATGAILGKKVISAPLSRRGNIFISFCRDVGR
jgi:tetratricopeptide (TPR) repeat protein